MGALEGDRIRIFTPFLLAHPRESRARRGTILTGRRAAGWSQARDFRCQRATGVCRPGDVGRTYAPLGCSRWVRSARVGGHLSRSARSWLLAYAATGGAAVIRRMSGLYLLASCLLVSMARGAEWDPMPESVSPAQAK